MPYSSIQRYFSYIQSPLEEEEVDVTGDVDVPLSIVPPESTEKQVFSCSQDSNLKHNQFQQSQSGHFPAEDAPISPIESPERQVEGDNELLIRFIH